MQSAIARAPVRIDLAGGTLDIWPLYLALPERVVTLNAALDLPVEARVEPREDGAIVLASGDLGREVCYADRASLSRAQQEGRCPLPLLAEAALACGPERGFSLTTRATPPAGSGLGSSSALLCAVLGALEAAAGRARSPHTLHPLVQDVETRLLGAPTGHQDYFPPLLGGCLAIEAGVGGIDARPLALDLEALGARLRLAYTGEPHESGLTNWGVLRAYFDGERDTREALAGLARAARRARDGLAGGDLDAALDAVLEDGRLRRAMAPGVSTPRIEALDAEARAAGARGTKICGAGGGGCVLVVLPAEDAGPAVDALLAAGPWEPLPLRLVSEGLRVEVTGP